MKHSGKLEIEQVDMVDRDSILFVLTNGTTLNVETGKVLEFAMAAAMDSVRLEDVEPSERDGAEAS